MDTRQNRVAQLK